jgi:hypothetical protein
MAPALVGAVGVMTPLPLRTPRARSRRSPAGRLPARGGLISMLGMCRFRACSVAPLARRRGRPLPWGHNRWTARTSVTRSGSNRILAWEPDRDSASDDRGDQEAGRAHRAQSATRARCSGRTQGTERQVM